MATSIQPHPTMPLIPLAKKVRRSCPICQACDPRIGKFKYPSAVILYPSYFRQCMSGLFLNATDSMVRNDIRLHAHLCGQIKWLDNCASHPKGRLNSRKKCTPHFRPWLERSRYTQSHYVRSGTTIYCTILEDNVSPTRNTSCL